MHSALPAAARSYLEELMSAQTGEPLVGFMQAMKARLAPQIKAEGKAEGEARALLRILAKRGVVIPAETHARISSCTDIEQLDDWLDRAATASTIEDVFG